MDGESESCVIWFTIATGCPDARVLYLLMQMCPRLGSVETVKPHTTTRVLLLCDARGSISGVSPVLRTQPVPGKTKRTPTPPLSCPLPTLPAPTPLSASHAKAFADLPCPPIPSKPFVTVRHRVSENARLSLSRRPRTGAPADCREGVRLTKAALHIGQISRWGWIAPGLGHVNHNLIYTKQENKLSLCRSISHPF